MMSLSVRPQRRLLSARVSRSQSFAGVLGSQERGPRAYLEVHQQEQEKLQRQIRESKRNSRLGFLYDLDKQVKSIERFLRRLEFHASKVLVQHACVLAAWGGGLGITGRWDDARPWSMCLLESELEAQLGEFHLRMKGLAGFARLCVGDQYEICMKYGRQRWKLRGRIEGSGKQVWDSEETVFLPLLTEFLSIKVTELKGLANHVVVGSVSCETKDLFAALPQVVAVDINDLGTIKLSLEVTWSPFDKDDQPSATSTVNKASTVTKRFSTYSQSPPDTPSLREQAFYNMLRRQEELENGTAWSLSSESSDDSSSPQLSGTARHSSAPRPLVQQPEPLPIQVAFRRAETSTSGTVDEERAMAPALANGHAPYSRTLSHISEASVDAALAEASVEAAGLESLVRGPSPPAPTDPTHGEHPSPVLSALDPGHSATSPTLSTTGPAHTSTDSAPSAHLDSVNKSINSSSPELPDPTHTTTSSTSSAISPTHSAPSLTHTTTSSTHKTVVSTVTITGPTPTPAPNTTDPVQTTTSLSHTVTNLTHTVTSPTSKHMISTLSTAGPTPTRISTHTATPNAKDPVQITRSPTHSVTRAAGGAGDRKLEEALGALMAALDDYRGQFPELQGLEQEVTRLESLLMRQGLTRSRTSSLSITVEHALESFSFLNEDEDNDSPGDRPPNSPEPGAEDSLDSPSARPLSTECPALDTALVQHLYHCSRLLLKLGTFGPLRCQEAWALERLLREARVLEAVCELSRRWEIPATSAQEVVQFSASRPGFLTFWDQCTEGLSPFICPVERVLLTFCNQYGARLSLRQPGLAEAVCVKFLEDALGQKLPRRPQSGPGEQLTVFQFWSYIEALDSSSMEAYVTETAEEVLLVRNLNSDDQAVVLKALRLAPEGRLRRDGLRALSSLLVHGNNKVMAAVSTQLRSLSLGPAFRERALLCFLDQLEDEDVQTRVAGCLALGCIKAPEGIEPLVYLCQTDTE
ncbi:hypothetical protein E2I00_011727, partial [Balaenoptera physalus]